GRLVGMLCAHDRPPFSVAGRMPDPERLADPGVRPLEVRLLAVEPEERHTGVFAGLIWSLYQFARRGHSHLVISGVENQVPLSEPPLYHRGDEFIELFAGLRHDLARLANAADVAVLVGSGTAANEAVAANLAAAPRAGAGLLLVNGHFGERLARQVPRFGLRPR